MSNQVKSPKGVITIRIATLEDADLLRELRLDALAKHPEAFAADYAATAEESVEDWSKHIAEYELSKDGVICVASKENQLIGMTGFYRGHWPKTSHNGMIWGVYVKKSGGAFMWLKD